MNFPWTQDTLLWVVQVAIVTLGLHVFLRFVRATRGNRLIRGLLVSVLGGYLGLRLVATWIEAEELLHLLEGSTDILLVALAIVFQTELRRGIALLGERSLMGRLIQPAAKDSLSQIEKAARSMASQRIGALIAFERETSLRSYIEEGTPIDAEVNARLLESLFHPGTALHDGAVIVRGDRVAAAGCFFPLPENAELDANLGTRHRAAVGITEDTDCVVVVVSEETGHISIAREGRIASRVEPANLEESLRTVLSGRDAPRGLRRPSLLPRSREGWLRDISWLLASLVIAVSVLHLSARDLTTTESRAVRVVAGDASAQPDPGEILVVLPSDDVVLRSPRSDVKFEFTVEGTRQTLDRLGVQPRGVYILPELGAEDSGDPTALASFIDLQEVQWVPEVPGLGLEWRTTPELVLDRMISIDHEFMTTELTWADDTLDLRFKVQEEGIAFVDPGREGVRLQGPESALAALEGRGAEIFEPMDLKGEPGSSERQPMLRLAPSVREAGISLAEPVQVIVPIQASERILDTLQVSVALVCFDPERKDELERWELPENGGEVQINVLSLGLVPGNAEMDSPVWSEKIAEVMRYVEDEVYAFADIGELQGDGARGVPVRFRLRTPDWREDIAPILLDDGRSGREAWSLDALTLRSTGDPQILLVERTPADE